MAWVRPMRFQEMFARNFWEKASSSLGGEAPGRSHSFSGVVPWGLQGPQSRRPLALQR